MPALPADIAVGMREATIASWSDTAVRARYPSARDGLAEPAEGFADLAAHGQAAANARGALLGVDRKRFTVPVQELLWIDPAEGLPTYRLVAPEHAVDLPTIPARIELDLNGETTSLEQFG